MISVYLHIPFCEVKCGYCDFYSLPRGHEDWDLQGEYVEGLLQEIRSRCSGLGKRRLKTLFLGGGTPSLLHPSLLEKILKGLTEFFDYSSTTEITFEANPGTVGEEKLRDFRSLGMNRISFGIQSFQDRFLKVLGRYHRGQDSLRAVQEARAAGFENINIDLIFGLPGQSMADWREDLKIAASLETPHLSAYNLTIEEGTPFAKLYPIKSPPLMGGDEGEGGPRITLSPTLPHRGGGDKGDLPSEEDQVRMFQETREFLAEKGLQAYEISNFARPGSECRHNLNYWEYGEYLGFGVSAASFINRQRRTNVRDLKLYLAGEWEGSTETISPQQAIGEFLFLGLRLQEGILKKRFESLFQRGVEEVYPDLLKKWVAQGLLSSTEERLVLTPKGVLFANEVFVDFLP